MTVRCTPASYQATPQRRRRTPPPTGDLKRSPESAAAAAAGPASYRGGGSGAPLGHTDETHLRRRPRPSTSLRRLRRRRACQNRPFQDAHSAPHPCSTPARTVTRPVRRRPPPLSTVSGSVAPRRTAPGWTHPSPASPDGGGGGHRVTEVPPRRRSRELSLSAPAVCSGGQSADVLTSDRDRTMHGGFPAGSTPAHSN